MRHYPRNSPQAAARILALALLADGDLSQAEIALLDRLRAAEQLSLSRSELHQVLHAFCEDLLATAHGPWAQACLVDDDTLAALMADISDPALRLRLLRLCTAIVQADEHVAEGESVVLMAAISHWGLHAALCSGELPAPPARPAPVLHPPLAALSAAPAAHTALT